MIMDIISLALSGIAAGTGIVAFVVVKRIEKIEDDK
jgi:hypothetical protein